MATYKFPEWEATIQNPDISLKSYTDNMDGTCVVTALLSLGAPNANAASFAPTLVGYTYVGEPTHAEMEAWMLVDLQQYEV